jgi:hypothetical protein
VVIVTMTVEELDALEMFLETMRQRLKRELEELRPRPVLYLVTDEEVRDG